MDRKPVRVVRFVVAFLVMFFLAVPFTNSASAQFMLNQQFAPYPTPPLYPYDRVEGECVNLETELIAPILCIPDPGPSVPGGDLVAVANDADERVVFLDMNLALVGETFVGQGPSALALNPSAPELWVSVRNQSSVVVIDLLSLTVKQVLRPAINVNGVGAGHASTPGGIAFANGKAYVAATFSDELLIYDAVATGHPLVKSLSLAGRFHDAAAILNDPYAVVSDGNQVLVTSHLSGNNTAPLCHVAGSHVNFDGKGRNFLGPDSIFIEALGPGSSSGLDLPDYDVAVVDATTDKVTRFVRGVGTVLFNVAAAPAGSGTFLVTNLDAQNTIIGEDAFPQGKVALNRLTQFNVNGTVTPPTVLEGLGAGGTTNIVMPTALEVLPDGRRLVAGYCSSNVGVLDGANLFLGAIPVPAGPRGIDYWAATNRIFVLSRATSQVTSFDAGTATTVPTTPLATFTLPDPTFDRVKQGRLEFLLPNSGAQTANCASCHVDGRNDGIGWNLSKRLSTNPNPVVADDFRDRKGVMVTQDLRGLPGAAPYHWRGEQKDIEDFNGAFEHLLHGTQLPADRLAKLKDYIFSLEYPPNPFETMNRTYSPLATSGFNVYTNNGTVGVCSKCHTLPLGTDGDITDPLFGDGDGTNFVDELTTKTTALRGLWTRNSAVIDADPLPGTSAVESIRMTGFGVLHEGMFDSVHNLIATFFQPLVANGTDDDVEAFVNELDSGLAPATLYSVLVDGGATVNANMDLVEFFLLDQARAGTPTLRGNCDVAAHGIIDLGSGRIPVGMVYRALLDKFDLSSSAVQATWEGQLGHPIRVADVRGLAVQGHALLLFAGVPSGSGERIGIDRDRDGVRDDDEITTDPKNPDSNNDGLWDGFVAGAPQIVNGSVQVVYATTDAIKISYETDRLSPTIVDFVESGGTTTYHSGDGFQAVGTGTSNQWRRRHTAFIRPQPPQGLTALRPTATYNFTILTQGQDDLRATFPGFTASADHNFLTDTFRCSKISVFQRTNNGNGTFTFDIRAVFEATQGNPTINGKVVPGRFILTDANDQLSFVNMSAQITNGVAIFQYITLGGPSPQQASGKPVFLDLPMWLSVGGTLVEFPDNAQGQWSDSVTSLETTAP
jgi:mono/diheme cytochrome c family protein